MKSFEFQEVTETTLKSVHFSKVMHGKELVQAVYLNLEREGSNDILDAIDPALREMHYYSAAEAAGQERMPDALRVLPDLRAPKNQRVMKYGDKDMYKGYRFELDYGLGGESNISFTDASAGKHVYECMEGGTAKHGFQVAYWGEQLTDDVVARLLHMERQKVFITLLAPSVLTLVKGGKAPKAADPEDNDDQQDLLGGDGDDEGGDETGNEDSAEQQFIDKSTAAA